MRERERERERGEREKGKNKKIEYIDIIYVIASFEYLIHMFCHNRSWPNTDMGNIVFPQFYSTIGSHSVTL